MGRITRSLSSNSTSSTRHAVHQQHKQQKHSKAVIGGAAAAGGVLLIFLLFLTLLVYRRVKKSSPRTSPADQQVRLRRFKYRELRSATGRFGEANKIGQGGFGSVYKGTLKNGQEVAVKKLDTASLQGEREFMNELSIVGSIAGNSGSHVVGLIGFCADSKRKMLVYEYMSNRSLQEALFDEKHSLQLDWEKRTKIILDVARALAFLHGKCEPPIVHGDVKPSNVLLDSQFSAKLADFGLARVKTEVQDLRSEDVQRDSMEQERARSQIMARDRERKRKKRIEEHARVHREQESKDEEQQNQHVIQVDQTVEVPKKAEGSPKNADKGTSGEETEPEQRLPAEKRLSPASGDESHESPVLSSPTSRRTEEHKISRAAGTPSSIGGADDDDDWSKMSQSAYGTEPDTWSKVSPSEMDCRSEISIDSSAQRSTMNFLGRKRRKKSASPSKSREWWWKQEGGVHAGGGEFSIKEYIVDWVSCERGRSRTREWPWNPSSTPPGKDGGGKKNKQARSGSLEWWAECDDNDDDELARRIKSEQKRKKKLQKQQDKLAMSVSRDDSRDWWRGQGGGNTPVPVSGELFDDLSGEITKNDENEKMKRSMSEESFTFYHSGEIPTSNTNNAGLNNSMELLANLNNSDAANGRRRVRTRSREWWSGEMQRGKEWWSGELSSKRMRNKNLPKGGKIFETWSRESLSGELSRRPRHHRDRSRSRSRDWWSGDLLSRTTVSSTPSMRGTVCYVAPEYGGGGMLTEKSDVYSFGVLVLVVVSGRRPLQVVASPLTEFERANLISWARHAAQAGRALDLVDTKLGGVYSKEQANLFLSVALLCLQRLPALRPAMSEVVKILSGEAELPALPFEFSPSPPGFKSRRKPSSEQVAVDLPLLTS